MPLVLATGAATESGHAYADVLGEEYEYPRSYRKSMNVGELFVYYRGRRIYGGGTRPQVYLGCGTVGPSRPIADGERLVCTIDDFALFEPAVPFRDADGYLEPGGTRRGYYQRGVRRVSDAVYARIVSAGLSREQQTAGPSAGAGSYALPLEARRIEEISRRAASDVVLRMPGVLRLEAMPFNNPGYDLLAVTADGPKYVEVKGTRGAVPKFFLSEGERSFSEANAPNFLLVVVTGVNLDEGSWGQVHTLEGEITRDSAELREHQWRGVLPPRLDPALTRDGP